MNHSEAQQLPVRMVDIQYGRFWQCVEECNAIGERAELEFDYRMAAWEAQATVATNPQMVRDIWYYRRQLEGFHQQLHLPSQNASIDAETDNPTEPSDRGPSPRSTLPDEVVALHRELSEMLLKPTYDPLLYSLFPTEKLRQLYTQLQEALRNGNTRWIRHTNALIYARYFSRLARDAAQQGVPLHTVLSDNPALLPKLVAIRTMYENNDIGLVSGDKDDATLQAEIDAHTMNAEKNLDRVTQEKTYWSLYEYRGLVNTIRTTGSVAYASEYMATVLLGLDGITAVFEEQLLPRLGEIHARERKTGEVILSEDLRSTIDRTMEAIIFQTYIIGHAMVHRRYDSISPEYSRQLAESAEYLVELIDEHHPA